MCKKIFAMQDCPRGYLNHLQTISLKKLPLCCQTAHMNDPDNLWEKNCHPEPSSLQRADPMRVIQIICRKIVIKECPLCNQTANMKDPDDLKEKSSHLQQFSLPMASQLYASYESCLSQSRLSWRRWQPFAVVCKCRPYRATLVKCMLTPSYTWELPNKWPWPQWDVPCAEQHPRMSAVGYAWAIFT